MSTTISLIQLGLGGVGRALVEQVLSTRAGQARYGIELRYVALSDSSGAVIDKHGLNEEVVRKLSQFKGRGGRLADAPGGEALQISELGALVDAVGQEPVIVLDTTAADPALVMPAFEAALARGGGVVLANKKPLTGSWAAWQRLTGEGRTRYEATVGAGLPVISTLRYLLNTGDNVNKIEGAFSGTLGFVMSQLQDGAPFGDVVREAKARGWTEPDPRDDLSGTDVARKALILARTLNYPLELSDVAVTALYPPEFGELSLDTFMARLDELNPMLAAQRDNAHAAGKRLRYAATVAPDKLTVGPVAVDPASPLGVLSGPDNLVAFQSKRYANRPLVVQGAGAGVEVTASAILGDILLLSSQI
ncbi:MAG: homoserine dehydrogenase [Ardenticatenaceae bacterium]